MMIFRRPYHNPFSSISRASYHFQNSAVAPLTTSHHSAADPPSPAEAWPLSTVWGFSLLPAYVYCVDSGLDDENFQSFFLNLLAPSFACGCTVKMSTTSKPRSYLKNSASFGDFHLRCTLWTFLEPLPQVCIHQNLHLPRNTLPVHQRFIYLDSVFQLPQ